MKLYTSLLQTIFFLVEKLPSVEIMKNPVMEFNSDNSYAIVATWPESVEQVKGKDFHKAARQKTLNFCSDVYTLIKNQDVLEPLIPVLEERFKTIEMRVGNDKDAQFGVRISPKPDSLHKMTECIVPLVTFTNSYDGKVMAQATGGMLRYLVDDQGRITLMYSTYLRGLSFSYKFKHNNEGIYSMLELSAKIDQYIADFAKVTDLVSIMKSIPVKTTPKKLEEFLREMSTGTIFPLKELEETMERIQYEMMVLDTDASLWTVYNAMNYIVENSDAALTSKHRMDVNAKIYMNIVEYMDAAIKKQRKALAAN